MTKERIIDLLKKLADLDARTSEIYAKSGCYDSANNYDVKRRNTEDIIRLINDADYFESIEKILSDFEAK